MSRILRGLAALVVLLLIVAGAPWLLMRLGRLDALTSLDWRQLVTAPDNGDLLVLVLTLVGWVAWAHVALTIVSELVVRVSHRRISIPVPGSQWLRPVAGALVAALVGLVLAQAVRASSPAAHGHFSQAAGPTVSTSIAPAPPAPLPTTSTAIPVSPQPVSVPDSAPRDPATGNRAATDRTGAPHDAPARYIVQPGDDLWTLAVILYDDGLAWHTLATANHLGADDPLYPGTVLAVPRLGQTEVSRRTGQAAIDTSPRTILVKPGDTLTRLARLHLGSAFFWPALQQANSGLVLEPNHLEPGWVLHLPPRLTAAADSRPSDPAGHPTASAAPTPQQETVPGAAVDLTGVGEHSDLPADPPVRVTDDVGTRATAPAGRASGTSPDGAAEASPDVPSRAGWIGGESAARGIIGGIATTVLTGVGIVLARRRRGQLWSRPVGRRVPGPGPDAGRFHQALQQLGAVARPDDPGGSPTTVVIGEIDARPGSPEVTVVSRLDELGALRIVGDPDLTMAAAGGIATSITCAPWSEGTALLVVAPGLHWLGRLDDPGIHIITDLDEGLAELHRTVTRRAVQPAPTSHEPLVAIIDLAPRQPIERTRLITRFQPLLGPTTGVVAVWICAGDEPSTREEDLPPVFHLLDEQRARLTGVDGWFVPNLVSEPARRALVELFSVTTTPDTDPAPWWAPDGEALARDAPLPSDTTLSTSPTASPGMLTLLPSGHTPPPGAAPSSAGRLPLSRRPATSDPEATMTRVPDLLATLDHPVLLLLGEVELVGARGPRPTRALKQCEEYCAWILEHPGQSALAMTRSLLVAEGTRRSNMSRLRTWLGSSDDGDDYLPDAYSGHIRLHPGITTDWEQLNLLMSAGVNRAGDDALVQALELVRGAPLADAAPGQWHWAEELRIDMASTIRDVGAVLASRALGAGDLDVARWAAARALSAAPEDELLLATRVRTEHLAGNRPEVERLVLHLTRQARLLGVDLSDHTITVLQEAMEGRARSRRA